MKSKLRNGRAFILLYQKNHPAEDFSKEIQQIEEIIKKLDQQASIESLMGLEGAATACYFKAYGRMMTQELRFEVRSKRPPKDPVNALLSLGYTLITNEILSLLIAHGLDPHLGFLHGIEYGRPSLALDLVEEFRHPCIDRFTLSLVNKQQFTFKDFTTHENNGVYLTDEARKRYFQLYGQRIRIFDFGFSISDCGFKTKPLKSEIRNR